MKASAQAKLISENSEPKYDHGSEHVHWDELIFKEKLIHFFKFHKKIIFFIYLPLALFFLLFLIVYFSPFKYPVLGKVFRSEVDVYVYDAKTMEPLEAADVLIDNHSLKTDIDGIARLKSLHPGKQMIKVNKSNYVLYENEIMIDFGKNTPAETYLKGSDKFVYISVRDLVSESPIEGATIEIGKESVKTSREGVAKFNRVYQSGIKFSISVRKEKYIDLHREIELKKDLNSYQLDITPVGKTYFISNRNNKYELFQSNLDGSQQEVILDATGNEDANTFISISPDNKWIALSSTRDAVRNQYKYLIPQLYIYNIQTESLIKLKTDLFFNILGWKGDNLIYTTDNTVDYINRNVKLISYNLPEKKEHIIASGKYLSAKVIKENIVYTQTDFDNTSSSINGIYSTNSTEGAKEPIYKGLISDVYRVDENKIIFSSQISDTWLSYDLNSKQLNKLVGAPPNLQDKESYSSSNNKNSIYIETRDGKSELYLKNKDNKSTKLTDLGSIVAPLTWINDEYIVFHSIKSNETATYIVSLKGGKAKKIVDVYLPHLNSFVN